LLTVNVQLTVHSKSIGAGVGVSPIDLEWTVSWTFTVSKACFDEPSCRFDTPTSPDIRRSRLNITEQKKKKKKSN
jgi:hypothetical protein